MNPYIMTSKIERILLKKVLNKLYSPDKFRVYLTDEYGNDIYDAVLYTYNNDGSVLDRFFVEVKVRSRSYSDIMLESKKFNDITSLMKRKDAAWFKETKEDIKSKLIYLSIHPNGSYWFSLSDIDMNSLEWLESEHNISTMNTSLGKKMKGYTLLDSNLAKKVDVKSNDIEEGDNKKIEMVMTSQRKMKDIFDFNRL